MEHYHIDENRAIHLLKATTKASRDICAFYILKNQKQPNEIYYADGHAAHADLLQTILNKFAEKIGISDRINLTKNFLKKWETKKGFIDPYKNGFKNFESINYALKQIVAEQNKKKNFFTKEDRIKTTTDSNNHIKLPNWFIVASSSQQQKNKK